MPDVPRIPAVIVDVLISKVSSALSFSVTLKNNAPLVSLSSSFLPLLKNSARLSFCSVTILESSRPTEARPSVPVFKASPDWKRMLLATDLVPPLESSILTVPSTRRSLIVVARYFLFETTMHTITTAAITNTAATAAIIFFSRVRFLNLSTIFISISSPKSGNSINYIIVSMAPKQNGKRQGCVPALVRNTNIVRRFYLLVL